jgi:hypothetical protein
MLSKSKLQLLIVFVLILCIFLIIAKKMSWESSPNYFYTELMGSHHFQALKMADLCSDKILAGLQGPTSNVTDQLNFSIFYAFIDKVFWNLEATPQSYFTNHRIFQSFVYLFILLQLYLLTTLAKWPFPIFAGSEIHLTFCRLVTQHFEHDFDLRNISQ